MTLEKKLSKKSIKIENFEHPSDFSINIANTLMICNADYDKGDPSHMEV